MPESSGLSVNSTPMPRSTLGRSFTGFFLSMLVAVAIVLTMELTRVGGSLVIAWAILFLLLPFGVDARLAGWVVATAVPTALHSLSVSNKYTPTCMPVADQSITSGCHIHVGWMWLAVASALVLSGIMLMAVVVTRAGRARERLRTPPPRDLAD